MNFKAVFFIMPVGKSPYQGQNSFLLNCPVILFIRVLVAELPHNSKLYVTVFVEWFLWTHLATNMIHPLSRLHTPALLAAYTRSPGCIHPLSRLHTPALPAISHNILMLIKCCLVLRPFFCSRPFDRSDENLWMSSRPVSSIQYPISSIQYPVSSIQHPVPSTRYSLLSTQYPVSDKSKTHLENILSSIFSLKDYSLPAGFLSAHGGGGKRGMRGSAVTFYGPQLCNGFQFCSSLFLWAMVFWWQRETEPELLPRWHRQATGEQIGLHQHRLCQADDDAGEANRIRLYALCNEGEEGTEKGDH